MQVRDTRLPGVVLIQPRIFRDGRGFFLETYHAERYAAAGVPGPFVQDNHSCSQRHTLRGLHFQWRRPQGKLVRAIEGEIYDVAVDIRPESPFFGQWVGATLSADNHLQIFVPPGFAHGFCVISETAQVEYKCTDVYDPEGEGGIPWDDPDLGIDWPTRAPILSARDQRHPSFRERFGRAPRRD